MKKIITIKILLALSIATSIIFKAGQAQAQSGTILIDDFSLDQQVKAATPLQFERNVTASPSTFRASRVFEIRSATSPASDNLRAALKRRQNSGGIIQAEAPISAGNSFILWSDQTINNFNLSDPNNLGTEPFLANSSFNAASCQGVELSGISFDAPGGANTTEPQAFFEITLYDRSNREGSKFNRAQVGLNRRFNNETIRVALSEFNANGPAGEANLANIGAISLGILTNNAAVVKAKDISISDIKFYGCSN
ncbi:MAG TPA: hypothetical protein PKD37_04365 [Oligoflexia bacterium]|nr:hypothetical protein [Oligoflexia bacterium]HMP27200.1 hypothetical protein [Oligoflexia bacterium]